MRIFGSRSRFNGYALRSGGILSFKLLPPFAMCDACSMIESILDLMERSVQWNALLLEEGTLCIVCYLLCSQQGIVADCLRWSNAV